MAHGATPGGVASLFGIPSLLVRHSNADSARCHARPGEELLSIAWRSVERLQALVAGPALSFYDSGAQGALARLEMVWTVSGSTRRGSSR